MTFICLWLSGYTFRWNQFFSCKSVTVKQSYYSVYNCHRITKNTKRNTCLSVSITGIIDSCRRYLIWVNELLLKLVRSYEHTVSTEFFCKTPRNKPYKSIALKTGILQTNNTGNIVHKTVHSCYKRSVLHLMTTEPLKAYKNKKLHASCTVKL